MKKVNNFRKKALPIMVAFMILSAAFVMQAQAQCTGVTMTPTTTAATCPWNGTITITLGGPEVDNLDLKQVEFQIAAHGSGGTNITWIVWDSLDTKVKTSPFVAADTYTIRMRAFCKVSQDWVEMTNSVDAVVASNPVPYLTVNAVITKTYQCTQDGIITVTFTSGQVPYRAKILNGPSGFPTTLFESNTPNSSIQITGLAAGTYHLLCYDSCGTAYEPYPEVTAFANPSAVIDNIIASCGNNGSFRVTFLDGRPPYKVTLDGATVFNTSGTGNIINIGSLTIGAHTIKCEDACGVLSTPTSVTVPDASTPAPSYVSSTQDAPSDLCTNNGSIKVTLKDGKAPYTITIIDGPSGYPTGSFTSTFPLNVVNVTGLGTGSYTLQCVDDCGNAIAIPSPIIVPVGPTPTATLGTITLPTQCTNTGSFRINFSTTGKIPFKVTITGSLSGTYTPIPNTFTSSFVNFFVNVTNLPADTYYIQCEDACGVITSAPTQVTVPATTAVFYLDVPAVVKTMSCKNSGRIALSFIDGLANYTVEIVAPVPTGYSGATTFTGINTSTYFLSSLPAGTYHLKVTDACGSVVTQDVEVGTLPDDIGPRSFKLTPNSTSCCDGAFITLVENFTDDWNSYWNTANTYQYAILINQSGTKSWTAWSTTLQGQSITLPDSYASFCGSTPNKVYIYIRPFDCTAEEEFEVDASALCDFPSPLGTINTLPGAGCNDAKWNTTLLTLDRALCYPITWKITREDTPGTILQTGQVNCINGTLYGATFPTNSIDYPRNVKYVITVTEQGGRSWDNTIEPWFPPSISGGGQTFTITQLPPTVNGRRIYITASPGDYMEEGTKITYKSGPETISMGSVGTTYTIPPGYDKIYFDANAATSPAPNGTYVFSIENACGTPQPDLSLYYYYPTTVDLSTNINCGGEMRIKPTYKEGTGNNPNIIKSILENDKNLIRTGTDNTDLSTTPSGTYYYYLYRSDGLLVQTWRRAFTHVNNGIITNYLQPDAEFVINSSNNMYDYRLFVSFGPGDPGGYNGLPISGTVPVDIDYRGHLVIDQNTLAAYVCEGEELGFIYVAAKYGTPPYTFQLFNEGEALTGSGTVLREKIGESAHFKPFGKSGETYDIKVINGACGNSVTMPITMIDLALHNITYTKNNGIFCEGQPIELNSISLGDSAFYNWEYPNGDTSTLQNPRPVAIYTDGLPHTYIVTVTKACPQPKLGFLDITVLPSGLPPAPVGNNVKLCRNTGNANIEILSGIVPDMGCELRWYANEFGGTQITSPVAYSTASAGSVTYYVSQFAGATACRNGESARISITITVEELSPATISIDPSVICVEGMATLSSSTTGTWINNSPSLVSLSGDVVTAFDLPGTASFYFIPDVGCASGVPVTLTIIAIPTTTIEYQTYIDNSMPAVPVTLNGISGGSFSATAGLGINSTTGTIYPKTMPEGSYTITYTHMGYPDKCDVIATATIVIKEAFKPVGGVFEIWNWDDLHHVIEVQIANPTASFKLMQHIGIPGQPDTYEDGSTMSNPDVRLLHHGDRRFGWYGYEGFVGLDQTTDYSLYNAAVQGPISEAVYVNGPWVPDPNCGWDGFGWQIIGNGAPSFTKVFEGNGKAATGLWINKSDFNQGLFGNVLGATIKNLGVNTGDDGVVSGSYSGILAGIVDGAIIDNCYTTGKINGNNYIGGLVGEATGTTISNCYANSTVNGNAPVGGLVALVDNNVTISNCYTTGDVTGSNNVGGLVGGVRNAIISQCYATGTVEATTNNNTTVVGGLIGFAGTNDAPGARIERSFALNPKIVAGPSVIVIGRVVGNTSALYTLTDNFAYMEGSFNGLHQSNLKQGADILTCDATKKDTYVTQGHWSDFATHWTLSYTGYQVEPGTNLPILNVFTKTAFSNAIQLPMVDCYAPCETPDWERLKKQAEGPAGAGIPDTIKIWPRGTPIPLEGLDGTTYNLVLCHHLDSIYSDVLETINITRTLKIKSASNDIIKFYTPTGITPVNTRHFTVQTGGNLTVESLILDGDNNAGGIQSVATGVITVNNATVRNCKYNGRGGGIDANSTLTLTGDVTISNNIASIEGGGIFARQALNLAGNITISNNTAAQTGGGIYKYSLSAFNTTGLTKLDLTGNTATTGNGGGMYTAITVTFTSGNHLTVSGNTAGQAGGGIYGYGTPGFVVPLSFTGATISNNSAAQNGGGIYANSSLTLSDVTVTNNTAAQNGGGIYANSTAALANSAISNNKAGWNGTACAGNYYGGGVYISTVQNLTASAGVTFSGNKAPKAYWVKDSDPAYCGSTGLQIKTYANNTYLAKPLGSFSAPPLGDPFVYAYNNYDVNWKGEEEEERFRYEVYAGSYEDYKLNVNPLIATYHWLQDAVKRVWTEDGGTLDINGDFDLPSTGNPYTIIATENDYDLVNISLVTPYVEVPADMVVTLASETGELDTIYQPHQGRHIILTGDLTLKNIVLAGEGHKTDPGYPYNGGINVASSGKLTVDSGAVIRDCFTSNNSGGGSYGIGGGGGAVLITTGTFILNGGVISDNVALHNSEGTGGNGGGVFSHFRDCSVIINGGAIVGNTAAQNGGGIFVDSTLTLAGNVTISNNTAGQYGGGIFAHTDFNLAGDVTISNNTAGQNGGGIYKGGAGTVTTTGLTKLDVIGNTATGSESSGGFGGGIHTDATVTFTAANHLTVSGNTAGREGGGISSTTITLVGATISGNKVINNGGSGGGILGGTITLEDCTIGGATAADGNTAPNAGGGIYAMFLLTLKGTSIISHNTSEVYGGGIHVSGSLTLEGDITISHNKTGSFGGGIFVSSLSGVVTAGAALTKLDITDNAVINNVTLNGSGGGIYTNVDLTFTAGNHVTISRNKAGSRGGGVTGNNGALSFTGVTISNNEAGTSGSIYSADGGGILAASSLTIDGCTIVGNIAGVDGGGIYANNDLILAGDIMISNNKAGRDGGGICKPLLINNIFPFTTTGLTKLDVTDNSADRCGGGIYTGVEVTFTSGNHLTLSRNKAGSAGGGIYGYGYGYGISELIIPLTFTGATISNNSAVINGGGIFARGPVTLSDVTVTNNTAGQNGGGICAGIYPVALGNATITNNKAGWNGTDCVGNYFGGGVYISIVRNLTASAGVTFSGNKAPKPYWVANTDPTYCGATGPQIKTYAYNTYLAKPPSIDFSAPPLGELPFDYAYNNYDVNWRGENMYEIWNWADLAYINVLIENGQLENYDRYVLMQDLGDRHVAGSFGDGLGSSTTTPGQTGNDPCPYDGGLTDRRFGWYGYENWNGATDLNPATNLLVGIGGWQLSKEAWNNYGWIPVGTDNDPFTGIFDGQNFTINSLWIEGMNNVKDVEDVGLFGVINGDATIRDLNIHLTDTIGGYSNVGALVGKAYYGSTINNCHVTGDGLVKGVNYSFVTDHYVDGESKFIGGLVGKIADSDIPKYGSITNCSVEVDVSGGLFVGGFLGATEKTPVINSMVDIKNCYATGNISGGNVLGGFVGAFYGDDITRCYATGNVKQDKTIVTVSGGNSFGGFVGFMGLEGVADLESTFMIDCYATGNVQGSFMVGGLIGTSWLAFTYDCYATGEVEGGACVGGVVGITVFSDIDHCFALNPLINVNTDLIPSGGIPIFPGITGGEFGRVVGFNGDNLGLPSGYGPNGFYSNLALSCMKVFLDGEKVILPGSDIHAASIHGDDVLLDDIIKGGDISKWAAWSLGDGNIGDKSWTFNYLYNNPSSDYIVTSNTNLPILAAFKKNLFLQAEQPPYAKCRPDSYEIWNWADLAYINVLIEEGKAGFYDSYILMQDLGDPNVAGSFGDGLGSSTTTPGQTSNDPCPYDGGLTNRRFGWYGYENWNGANNLNPATNLLVGVDGWQLSKEAWNNYGWIPVGKDSDPFTGIFLGQNFTINDLWIEGKNNVKDVEDAGLFGVINGDATIRNLNIHLTDTIGGYSNVGALVGKAYYGSTINDCHVTGDGMVKGVNYSFVTGHYVDGESKFIGGLVGKIEDSDNPKTGSITKCSVEIDVSGGQFVGGFLGLNEKKPLSASSVQISDCYAAGNISGSNVLGGFAGAFYGDEITRCYAIGNVKQDKTIVTVSGGVSFGGFVGTLGLEGVADIEPTFMTNCYATGNVKGSNMIGGLIGMSWYAFIDNCYATGELEGGVSVGGVVGLTIYTEISECFALNPLINVDTDLIPSGGIPIFPGLTGGEFGRVIGFDGDLGLPELGPNVFSNNHALSCMLIFLDDDDVIVPNTDILANGIHGANVLLDDIIKGGDISKWAAWNIGGVWTFNYLYNNPSSDYIVTNNTNLPILAVFKEDDFPQAVQPPYAECRSGIWEIWNWDDLSKVMEKQNNEGYTRFKVMQDIGMPNDPTTFGVGYGDGIIQSPYYNDMTIDSVRKYGWYGYEGYDGLTAAAYSGYTFTPGTDLHGWKNTAPDNQGWIPIGSFANFIVEDPFTGNFNGQGFTVTGLWLKRYSRDYYGLFGYANEAEIYDLHVVIPNGKKVETDMESVIYCGGLVGMANSSTISDCSVAGAVLGGQPGGLIGLIDEGIVERCFSSGTVTGGKNVCGGLISCVTQGGIVRDSYSSATVRSKGYSGGLIGYAYFNTISNAPAVIENCYASGAVILEDNGGTDLNAGGLVSEINGVRIENCYATGTIEGPSNPRAFIGGLVGFSYYTDTIRNCYSAGLITANTPYLGGLLGYLADHNCLTVVENCYFDVTTTGTSILYGYAAPGYNPADIDITPYTTTQMIAAIPTLWSTSVWAIDEEVTYPYLKWQLNTNRDNTYEFKKIEYSTDGGSSWNKLTADKLFATSESVTVRITNTDGYATYNVYGSNLPLTTGATITLPAFTVGAGQAISIGVRSQSDIIAFTPRGNAFEIWNWADLAYLNVLIENQSAFDVKPDSTLLCHGDKLSDYSIFLLMQNLVKPGDESNYADGLGSLRNGNIPCNYMPTERRLGSYGYENYLNAAFSGNYDHTGASLLVGENTGWALGRPAWDMSNVGDEEGWIPIGKMLYLFGGSVDYSKRFKGHFDGQRFEVNDLWINAPYQAYLFKNMWRGLFGLVYGTTIENVGVLISDTLKGHHHVGGLVGAVNDLPSSEHSTIRNCYVMGNVSGFGDVGGLIGIAYDASIINCYATGSVTGGCYLGGLVGVTEVNTSTLINCYATSSVTVTVEPDFSTSCGGLVGAMEGTIINCYATGDVKKGKEKNGGLVGEIRHGSIENSYATGDVMGTNDYVGGLVGAEEWGVSNITNCYALNSSVTCKAGTNVGRVLGTQNPLSILTSNYALNCMYLNGDTIKIADAGYGANNIHGENITISEATTTTPTIGDKMYDLIAGVGVGAWLCTPYTTDYRVTPETNLPILTVFKEDDFPQAVQPPMAKCIEGCDVKLLTDNDEQTVCLNNPIVPIVYAVGAEIQAIEDPTGLPLGVSYTISGGFLTISGAPKQSGIFNFELVPEGVCNAVTITGKITVYPTPQAPKLKSRK